MSTAFVPARWQHVGRLKPVRVIVVHCTVSQELGTGAEAVANYFATSDRPGSTHLVSDSNSTVRCVLDGNTAYGAAGVNADGLHIELVGMPDQSAAQWLDPYSRAELAEAGPHIAAWSTTYDVPLRWLTVAEVADGVSRGLCTHADASAAFPAVSTGHWDPGPHFPKAEALALWAAHAPTPVPSPRQEYDDMHLPAMIVRSSDPAEKSWWLTDYVTKQHVSTTEHADALRFFGVAKWDDAHKRPFSANPKALASIRTVV